METFGRRQIFADEEQITAENVGRVLRTAYNTHSLNRSEIVYLYERYRGKAKIYAKQKTVRPEINYKVSEARENQIVSFKVGYLVGKPIQYISSVADEAVAEAVTKLNDMMRNAGKITKDRNLVEWQMVCGTGYRLSLPNSQKGSKVPFETYTLDPRQTFVAYRNNYTERPLMGVTYKTEVNTGTLIKTFTVYTEEWIFTVNNDFKLVATEKNRIGLIPIVEYPANTPRLGCFELVCSLIDAIDEVDSNRMDSVAQFVESLLIAYNCNFEEGTTAQTIRENGMIALRSTSEYPADIKIISEYLDQTNTETLKKSMLQTMYEIVGMPSQSDGSSSDSSNNGAIVLKNGWQNAETRAEEYEAMFQLSEHETLRIVSTICAKFDKLSFDADDIEVKFTRRAYDALLEKSQTLVTLLNAPFVHPRCAYEASGLFVDTEEATQMGIAWQTERENKLAEQTEQQKQEGEEDEPSETSEV